MAIPRVSATAAPVLRRRRLPGPSQPDLHCRSRDARELFPGKNVRCAATAPSRPIVGESTLGIDIHYYVQVDMGGFRDVIDTPRRCHRRRPAPVYDSRYATRRRPRRPQALHPARHPLPGWRGGARLLPVTSCEQRLRPVGAPDAHHHRLRNQIDIPSLIGDIDKFLRHHQEGHPDQTSLPSCCRRWPVWSRASTSTSASRSSWFRPSTARQCERLPASTALCANAGPEATAPYALVAERARRSARRPEHVHRRPGDPRAAADARQRGRGRPRPQRHQGHQRQDHQHLRSLWSSLAWTAPCPRSTPARPTGTTTRTR